MVSRYIEPEGKKPYTGAFVCATDGERVGITDGWILGITVGWLLGITVGRLLGIEFDNGRTGKISLFFVSANVFS